MKVYVMTCDSGGMGRGVDVLAVYKNYEYAMEEADRLEQVGKYPVDSLFVDEYTLL